MSANWAFIFVAQAADTNLIIPFSRKSIFRKIIYFWSVLNIHFQHYWRRKTYIDPGKKDSAGLVGSFFVKLTILPVLRIRYQGFQMTEMLITSIFIEKSRCCYGICFLFIPEYPVRNSSDFPYYYFAKFKLLRNTIHKSSICLHFSCTTDHFFDGSEIKIIFLSRRDMRPAKPPQCVRSRPP